MLNFISSEVWILVSSIFSASGKLGVIKKLLGNNYFDRAKSESKSKKFRRSIFVVKNIKKGDKFTKENIKIATENVKCKSLSWTWIWAGAKKGNK